jgi:hypothetical protein
MRRISDIDDQNEGTLSGFGLVPDVSELPALPRFKIRTSEQRMALNRLKLARYDRYEKRDFLDLVLGYLALIEELRHSKAHTWHPRAKNLRRAAARISRFNKYLRTTFILSGLLGPSLSVSMGLRQIADDFDRQASAKHLTRRKVTTEVRCILELVEYVQVKTENEHWKELVTLLQAATGDQGYNSHRLQALCSFHRPKKKRASRLLSGHWMKRGSG